MPDGYVGDESGMGAGAELLTDARRELLAGTARLEALMSAVGLGVARRMVDFRTVTWEQGAELILKGLGSSGEKESALRRLSAAERAWKRMHANDGARMDIVLIVVPRRIGKLPPSTAPDDTPASTLDYMARVPSDLMLPYMGLRHVPELTAADLAEANRLLGLPADLGTGVIPDTGFYLDRYGFLVLAGEWKCQSDGGTAAEKIPFITSTMRTFPTLQYVVGCVGQKFRRGGTWRTGCSSTTSS